MFAALQQRYCFGVALCAVLLLFPAMAARAQGVMNCVISTTDDTPSWDDPSTQVNEKRDGICMDVNGECSLRAALEEATLLNLSVHMAIPLVIDMQYATNSTFPDYSIIDGPGVLIDTRSKPVASVSFGNGTLIQAMRFENIVVTVGAGSKLTACIFHNASLLAGGSIVQNCTFEGTSPTKGSLANLTSNGKCIIAGNTFKNNASMTLVGLGGDTVRNNTIGLDAMTRSNTVVTGITISSANNSITGNTISGNRIGIEVAGGDKNTIADNIIGLDNTQSVAAPNNTGIATLTPAGSLPPVTKLTILRNVISGNSGAGMLIDAPTAP